MERVTGLEPASSTPQKLRFCGDPALPLFKCLRHGGGAGLSLYQQTKKPAEAGFSYGAGYRARTGHLHLGKVALYQMS